MANKNYIDVKSRLEYFYIVLSINLQKQRERITFIRFISRVFNIIAL